MYVKDFQLICENFYTSTFVIFNVLTTFANPIVEKCRFLIVVKRNKKQKEK